ncbi:MAG: beta-lactamase family protein [Arenimonas sp.]|uniref:serine hydrolase domain-containing protein n=1 Tax=Arenimonas sp. TaxID=1872635 RepID=UPI0025C700A3|nr:serine hydrolase domain-containing protein [Arenimonas sp.]MBW8367114.1 beta-lactamase family protein [Arenimonas sp.]
MSHWPMRPTEKPRRFSMAWLGLSAVLLLPAATPARPLHDFAPVDAGARQLVLDYGLPGASLRLSRGGVALYRENYGAYTGSERLAIASASKWLSALTLARLVERGDLRWDSTVGDFFPAAAPAMRPITLAQLFSHTSGITVADIPCLADRQKTLQACALEILAVPRVAAPGTVFAYGGNSMQVAGAMAELATGESWDDLFIREVAQPLGLINTDWTAGAVRDGYVRNANPRIGGGARSTLDDYGRVLDMLLAGGLHEGSSFLRADTLATMAFDRTVGLVVGYTPVPGYDFGYGIGQWVEARDASGATYRVSSPGAFGFTPWVDWRSGSSGVIVVSGDGSRMRDDLTALEGLCLRQLDFVRTTNAAHKPSAGAAPAAHPAAAPPLPASPARAAPPLRPALDGKGRAL